MIFSILLEQLICVDCFEYSLSSYNLLIADSEESDLV